MHVKLNVKKSVCAKHVAQSNSPSVNQRWISKAIAAGFVPGGFFCLLEWCDAVLIINFTYLASKIAR
jgi:hypothetical protein